MVGIARSIHRVVVDVDNVIQHAHCGMHGVLELVAIKALVSNVLHHVDGAEVAHGNLVLAGVQCNFSTQVGRVHGSHMLLRRAHVAGILERNPRMAGFEQHAEHFAPQVFGIHHFVHIQLAIGGFGFIFLVAGFEGLAVQVVQVGHFVG